MSIVRALDDIHAKKMAHPALDVLHLNIYSIPLHATGGLKCYYEASINPIK